MRVPRILAVLVFLAVGVASSTSRATAQQNNNSFKNFIDVLNTGDAAMVQTHLASDFSLTFTGGTTVTGSEAVDMLLLLDRPIAIDSVSSDGGGSHGGTAHLTFGSGQQYTVTFTGAMGGNLASLTIGDPNVTSN
jgi:hypothetical protein